MKQGSACLGCKRSRVQISAARPAKPFRFNIAPLPKNIEARKRTAVRVEIVGEISKIAVAEVLQVSPVNEWPLSQKRNRPEPVHAAVQFQREHMRRTHRRGERKPVTTRHIPFAGSFELSLERVVCELVGELGVGVCSPSVNLAEPLSEPGSDPAPEIAWATRGRVRGNSCCPEKGICAVQPRPQPQLLAHRVGDVRRKGGFRYALVGVAGRPRFSKGTKSRAAGPV